MSGVFDGEGRMKTTDSTQGGEPKSPRRRSPSKIIPTMVPSNPVPSETPHSTESISGQDLTEQPSRMSAPERPVTKKDDFDPEVSQRERIALLAYSYWEARGRRGGTPEEDWFRAEHVILGNTASPIQ